MSDSLDEITCENCIAACCRAPVNMALTTNEYERNRATMDLRVLVTAKPYKQRVEIEIGGVDRDGNPNANITLEAAIGYGLFELQTGCGNLTEDNSCSIYDKRPSCCRSFELRSPACFALRRQAGLDADRPEMEFDPRVTQQPRTATEKLLAKHFPTYTATPDATTTVAETPPVVGTLRAAPLEISAARALFKRESRWISTTLARLSPEQWQNSTRCAEWNVQDIVAHVITSQRFVHEVLSAAIDGRQVTDADPFEGDVASTITAFDVATQQLAQLVTPLTPEDFITTIDAGGSPATVRHLVHVLALELVVHGSDIAAAIGETRRIHSDSLRAIATVLPRLLDEGELPIHDTAYVLRSEIFELPFTWRDDSWNLEPGPNPCWIEGSGESVLLFALGRQTFDAAQLVTNDAARASSFKRYLPGP